MLGIYLYRCRRRFFSLSFSRLAVRVVGGWVFVWVGTFLFGRFLTIFLLHVAQFQWCLCVCVFMWMWIDERATASGYNVQHTKHQSTHNIYTYTWRIRKTLQCWCIVVNAELAVYKREKYIRYEIVKSRQILKRAGRRHRDQESQWERDIEMIEVFKESNR